MDFAELEGTDLDWEPDDTLAWRCLGIPGYCTFRCRGCGAVIPDAVARGRPVTPPFVCGDTRCIGKRRPPDGAWIRVRGDE